MGIAYEQIPVKNHHEVVHPGHPPLIDTGVLADAGKKYKAGTILKIDPATGKMSAAALADTPAGVLVEDPDGRNAEVSVLFHGAVVFGRLLDSSGLDANPATEAVAATTAMAVKLMAVGIHPLQLFTSAKVG
jgi:hypothetical protein